MTEYRLISSDSHVTMPDAAWPDYLSPEFRDRAPRVEHTDDGDVRVFEGKRTPIMTLDNLAGKKPEEFKLNVRKLDEQRAGAWDPVARIQDMDTDGVDAEVLYVGGPLQTADAALHLDSVRGYNRWLSDYANMYGDLSAGSGLNALLRDEGHAREFLKRHQDKLLFGSDCNDREGIGPKCQGSQTIAAIRRLAPDHSIERKLLYGNAKKLMRM